MAESPGFPSAHQRVCPNSPGAWGGPGGGGALLLSSHCTLRPLHPRTTKLSHRDQRPSRVPSLGAVGPGRGHLPVCRSLSIAPARPGRAPCEQVSPAHGGGGLSIMPRTELSRAYGGKVGRRAVQLHAHFYKGTGHRALQGGRSRYINTGRSPTWL